MSGQNQSERPSSAVLSWKEQLKPTDHMGGSRDSWAIPASSFRFDGDLKLDKQDHSSGHIENIVDKVLKLDKRYLCYLLLPIFLMVATI